MSTRAAYFGLLILTLVALCANIDRALISIVLEPVKREFGLSDGQLGFLSGFAFAVAHACTAIPFGRMADRRNRRNIVAAAVACWSIATGLCGFALNYVQLVIYRAGVGFGEAAGQAASLSMVSDYVAPENRSTAMSLFYLSVPLGGLFAMAGAGLLIASHGWRAAFVVAAIPGVVLALAMLLLREPERGGQERAPATDREDAGSFLDVLRYIHSNRPLFHLMMAIMVMTLVVTGVGTWAPAFFLRSHGMTIGHVGLVLGLGTGVLGTISLLVTGPIADRLARRNESGAIWVVIGACLFQIPVMVIAFNWHHPAALYVYALIALGAFVWMGPGLAATQTMTPPRIRSTVAATIYTLNGVVGYGLGPQLIGSVSDLLTPLAGDRALAYAITAVALLQFWAIAHLLLAIRAMRARAVSAE